MPADNAVPAELLTKWLSGRKRAAALRSRLPNSPLFQMLPTSQRVLALLDIAKATGRLISITGAPGTSKSASARQYCASNTRAWLATMDPSTSGVPTMLLEVLAAMGEPEHKGTPQVLSKRVVTKAAEAKGLIIIDEAQHLSDKAIDQIRAISDTTRRMGVPSRRGPDRQRGDQQQDRRHRHQGRVRPGLQPHRSAARAAPPGPKRRRSADRSLGRRQQRDPDQG